MKYSPKVRRLAEITASQKRFSGKHIIYCPGFIAYVPTLREALDWYDADEERKRSFGLKRLVGNSATVTVPNGVDEAQAFAHFNLTIHQVTDRRMYSTHTDVVAEVCRN